MRIATGAWIDGYHGKDDERVHQRKKESGMGDDSDSFQFKSIGESVCVRVCAVCKCIIFSVSHSHI